MVLKKEELEEERMFLVNQVKLKLFILGLMCLLAVNTQEINSDLEEETKAKESSLTTQFLQIIMGYLKVISEKIVASNKFGVDDEKRLLTLIKILIELNVISENETLALMNLLKMFYALRRRQEKAYVMIMPTKKRPTYMHWRQGR